MQSENDLKTSTEICKSQNHNKIHKQIKKKNHVENLIIQQRNLQILYKIKKKNLNNQQLGK